MTGNYCTPKWKVLQITANEMKYRGHSWLHLKEY